MPYITDFLGTRDREILLHTLQPYIEYNVK